METEKGCGVLAERSRIFLFLLLSPLVHCGDMRSRGLGFCWADQPRPVVRFCCWCPTGEGQNYQELTQDVLPQLKINRQPEPNHRLVSSGLIGTSSALNEKIYWDSPFCLRLHWFSVQFQHLCSGTEAESLPLWELRSAHAWIFILVKVIFFLLST